MGVALALLSAFAFGASDFAAGIGSRRFAAGVVAVAAQGFGVLIAAIALIPYHGDGGSLHALSWGALAGLGSAAGTLSLYRGLAVGRMSVVATLSAVLTAVIPVIVGLALGDSLSAGAGVGIVLAVAAIALVSSDSEGPAGSGRQGTIYGLLAGLAFALLLIALDRAGTHAGALPLLCDQVVSVLLIVPFALRDLRLVGRPQSDAVAVMVIAGILSGTANLLFLIATGHGQLAIVAVLTAFYPAVTVILARVFLAERWSRSQALGLLAAAAAIALVTLG